MMPTKFQRSFAGGIITQPNLPRADTARVAAGAHDIQNCWVLMGGACENRPGTRFIQRTKDQGDWVRIRRFFFNDEQAYALEVGEEYIRLFQLAEPIEYATPEVIPTTYWLGTNSDDLAAITANGGTIEASQALRLYPGEPTEFIGVFAGSPAADTLDITFATPSGTPGGTGSEHWPTGPASCTIRVERFPGYNITSGLPSQGNLQLSVSLSRVNAAGVTVSGPFASTTGSQIIATNGVTPVPADWTFNWTSVVWGGTFSPGDRLILRVTLTASANWNPVASISIRGAHSFLTTVVGPSTTASLAGWDPDETYEPGDVVAMYPVLEPAEDLYLTVGAVAPTPSGFPGTLYTGTDPFGRLTRDPDAVAGTHTISLGNSISRYILWVTDADIPDWATFPEAPIAVTLRFTSANIAVGNQVTLTVTANRVNSANVLQATGDATGNFAMHMIGSGVDYTILCNPPSGGWGVVAASDRLAIRLLFSGGAVGGSKDFTIAASNVAIVTPELDDVTADAVFFVASETSTGVNPNHDDDDQWSLSANSYSLAEQYVPGDVVIVPHATELGREFQISDEGATPTPSGTLLVTTEDPYATLIGELDTPVVGSLSISVPTGTVERQVLMTSAGEPEWTAWPEASVTVSLRFANITGTGPFNVTCTIVRFNSAGVRQTQTYVASAASNIILLGVAGTVSFTCPIPSNGWGTTSTTDLFGIEVTYTNNGPDTATASIETGHVDSFVITAPIEGEGFDAFYAVATHTGKHPNILKYQNDFWYPLPPVASFLLEIPSVYLAEDVPDLQFVQSGDTITITHEDYPPHELVRHFDEVYPFGRWTLLPIGFKPLMEPVTGITSTDGGQPDGKTIRYKVTAIDEVTGIESGAGGHATTSIATVNSASAQSTTADLLFNDTLHLLETGDEIFIQAVTTVDPDRANENAIIALKNLTWVVERVDADNFRLKATAGLLTLPVLTDIEEGYPQFTITWAKAYIEYVGVKIPKGAGATRIAFEWAAPATMKAKAYFIYRMVKGQEDWGLLGDTTELEWADEGDSTDGVANDGLRAVADTDTPPPDYRNPFRFGVWPRASGYHGQRQWFGGTINYPLRAWGSVTGDFRNFSTRTPITPPDAIDFTIASEQANEIQSLAAMGLLIIYTTGAVWALTGDVSGTIRADEPPNLQSLTFVGASRTRPLPADDVAIFFQSPLGSIPRMLTVDLNSGGPGGYDGDALSHYAIELFKGFTFEDFARMEIPNNLIFVIRSDGTMLGLTFSMAQGVAGWHRHVTRPQTDRFQSCCQIPEEGSDALYVITQRSVDGADVWSVERMDQRRLGEHETDPRREMYFLDAGLTFDGLNTSAITLTLTGGTTWAPGNAGLTLTASAALFVSGDVDNGYRLRDVDSGDEVEVIVTGFTSTTVVTVKIIQTLNVDSDSMTAISVVPTSLRSTAIVEWTKMVDDISGLDHLEGEVVGIFADGHYLGTDTVASGAIGKLNKFTGAITGANFPNDRPYGVIHVGLLIEAYFRTLPIDNGDEGPVSAALKRTVQALVWLHRSYHPKILPVSVPLAAAYPLPVQHGDTDTTLIDEPRLARMEPHMTRTGSVEIRQFEPKPLTVTALFLEYELGGI